MQRALINLRPLISQVFNFEDTVEAWRFMQDKKHTGKVVITVQ
ncbi:zinc-binding dehydrogenase [Erwinia tasmaniensis]